MNWRAYEEEEACAYCRTSVMRVVSAVLIADQSDIRLNRLMTAGSYSGDR